MFKHLLNIISIGVFTSLLANDMIIDNDNDLVPDDKDRCLNTPQGVCVDRYGCTQEIKRVIHFEQSSHKINLDEMDKLKDVIEIASECFGYTLLISGNTDSTYTKDYNMYLSKKRAKSIKKLLNIYGVDPKRIKVKWYGEANPISTNVTKQGRYKNRRVEILFY
ncbi:MAG: OmpA family protein [Campylobacterota bacterium]|nr:OmpA family protein [Campylobacterota bacterium]